MYAIMDFYHFPAFDKAGLSKRISTEDVNRPKHRRRSTWPLPLPKIIEQPRLRFLDIPKLIRYGDLRPAHSIDMLIRNVREREGKAGDIQVQFGMIANSASR